MIGGLGNQMFQYAAGLALSQERDTPLFLAVDMFDTYSLHQGFELERVFGIETPRADKEVIRHLLGWRANANVRRILAKVNFSRPLRGNHFTAERQIMRAEDFFSLSDNNYLHGYWQSDRFFSKYEKIIQKAFSFAEDADAKNLETLERIKDAPSASIHIRRGDYLKGRNKFIYHQCTPTYFLESIELLNKKIQSLKFYVFSDDPEWASSLLSNKGYDVSFISHNRGQSSYRDMQLISACNHNIISNSTFSWWGAWLNGNKEKIIIAPKEWMKGVSSSEIVPESWVKI